MVWDGNYPWDVRVEKILNTLNAWGHETHLVCRNSNAQPRRETHNGTHLRRLFAFRDGPLKKLNGALNFPAFFSPLWLREIGRAIDEIKPNVIIIRDLPIAPAVVWQAKRRGVPTILDMAECYPELIRCVWQFDRFHPANILVRNPYFADAVERYVVRNVDLIWVMVEESAERLVRKGIAREKLVKVSNTPKVDAELAARAPAENPCLTVVYVGLINPSRGVATAIEAAAILRDRGVRFRLRIAGSGKDAARVERLVDELRLRDSVELLGWIDRTKVQAILDQSDVGLVPHFDCSHWNSTIPNKLFDYMRAKIPVVVSNVRPAQRIVDATGCGLVFRSGDALDLANQLERLQDRQLRERLGRAGSDAIASEYNWETDSARLKTSMELTAAL